jgi:hypothetical protein
MAAYVYTTSHSVYYNTENPVPIAEVIAALLYSSGKLNKPSLQGPVSQSGRKPIQTKKKIFGLGKQLD